MRLQINADIPDRWVPHFVGFLERLQYLGAVGCSRTTSIFADGDGDFRPRFEISSIDGDVPQAAAPSEDFSGRQVFDAG